MPSCVVKGCKNNSTNQKKDQGITFHRFHKGCSSDWFRILRNCRGEDNWVPSKTSVICSIHFDMNDFYTTKNGFRRLVSTAVPKLTTPITGAEETNHKKSSSFEPSALTSTSTSLLQTMSISGAEETNHKKPSPFEPSGSIGTSISLLETTSIGGAEEMNHKEPSSLNPSGLTCNYLSLLQSPTRLEEEATSETYFDTHRKQHLMKDIKKDIIIKNQKIKIKTLNQKIRRLQSRNKYLKDILIKLRKTKLLS